MSHVEIIRDRGGDGWEGSWLSLKSTDGILAQYIIVDSCFLALVYFMCIISFYPDSRIKSLEKE